MQNANYDPSQDLFKLDDDPPKIKPGSLQGGELSLDSLKGHHKFQLVRSHLTYYKISTTKLKATHTMLLERINKLAWGVALLLSLWYAYIFFQVSRSKG